MERRVNFVLVGSLVVALTVTLIGVILWLGAGDYGTTYDRYRVYMTESVAGLNINSPVKYNGVEVGYVSEIVLNPENPAEVRLTLDIRRGTPVKTDTVAMLYVQGLTGFAIVDLTGGSPGAPILTSQPGEPHPVIRTNPSFFARVDRAGTHLITNLNRVLEDARGVIAPENQATVRQILTDLAALTNALAGHTDRVEEGVASAAEAADELAQLTRTLNRKLPALLTRIDRSMASVEQMTRNVSRTSETLGTVVQGAGPTVEQFSRETLAETGLLVAELRQLTASLTRLSHHLEDDPQSLVFGRAPAPPGPGE